MLTFFNIKDYRCIHIYTDKSNWKLVLKDLYAGAIAQPFFFFLDAERGYHIKVFAADITEKEIDSISQQVKALPLIAKTAQLDPIFLDVPSNAVIPVYKINEFIDFMVESDAHADQLEKLLVAYSKAIFTALLKKDYFLEESKRINFAIQVAFLSLVRAELSEIKQSLINGFKIDPNSIPAVDTVLINFFKDVQKIEDEPLDEWVKMCIEASEAYLSTAPYHSIVEGICQILEVRSFTNQLLYTTLGVLK